MNAHPRDTVHSPVWRHQQGGRSVATFAAGSGGPRARSGGAHH